MTKEWKLFIRAGCVICAVWLASFVLICLCIDDWDVRGQFGDPICNLWQGYFIEI